MTIVMGCDYSDSTIPARVLVAHGAQFAGRYASTPGNPKNLTAHEVEQLTAAGIGIVSIFETTAFRALAGEQAGKDDAHSAWNQFAALGMPAGRPIYFTVDFDMQPSQESAVAQYFDGAADELGEPDVGVYGGKSACEFVHGSGRAGFMYQTYAWSHGLWAATTHIRQTQNGLNWSGYRVDLDEAHATDFGQWSPGSAPVPTPTPGSQNWTDTMIKNLPVVHEGQRDPIGGSLLVHRVQAVLRDVAGYRDVAADGDFGPITRSAVQRFQGAHDLVQDGIIGQHTWARLLADQAL